MAKIVSELLLCFKKTLLYTLLITVIKRADTSNTQIFVKVTRRVKSKESSVIFL